MWWIVFFIVLPLNITTHMDKGINIKGIHGSVPINPKLVYKLIVTTIVTFIILLSLVLLFYFDILTMNKILSID
jgi:predicted secreted protein|tara:strand:- start:162 stop:383 length:222 start_codon:yes stop_codon:yes gene_type:complete